jgi:hypothetical protein
MRETKQSDSVRHVIGSALRALDADIKAQQKKLINQYNAIIKSNQRLYEGRATRKDIDVLVTFIGGRKQALLAENRRNAKQARLEREIAPPGAE